MALSQTFGGALIWWTQTVRFVQNTHQTVEESLLPAIESYFQRQSFWQLFDFGYAMVTEKIDLLLLFGLELHRKLYAYGASIRSSKFFLSPVGNVTDLKLKTLMQQLQA